MLLGEISQNWAVVPIVLGAIGYLLVAWRRSTRRGGSCCGHARSCMPSLNAPDAEEPSPSSPRQDPQQFVHADQLAYRASALRKAQDDRAAVPR